MQDTNAVHGDKDACYSEDLGKYRRVTCPL
jgi:hypothetical protein